MEDIKNENKTSAVHIVFCGSVFFVAIGLVSQVLVFLKG